jgi:WD40 repeat protein
MSFAVEVPGLGALYPRLELWDLTRGTRLPTWSEVILATSFQFSPDGQLALVAGSFTDGKGGVAIRDIPSGRIVRTFADQGVDRVQFTPDGKRVLAVTWAKAKEKHTNDLRDGREMTEWTLGRVSLFNVSIGGEEVSWRADRGTWISFAVSPNGQYVASGDEDGTLHLWDSGTGTERVRWQAHEAGLTALAFHPESHVLVSGARDGELKVWNLPFIRKELAKLGLDW